MGPAPLNSKILPMAHNISKNNVNAHERRGERMQNY